MADRIFFVAGLGRCGTTCVMNMLWRGGVLCGGRPPAFEFDAMNPTTTTSQRVAWLRQQGGRAVKWIDPQHASVPMGALATAPAILLMTRDPRQQAKSQLKLLSLTLGLPVNRDMVRGMAAGIKSDTAAMERLLRRTGTCHRMTFEWLLAHPRDAAARLALIASDALGATLDIDAAAAVVRPRSAACAPDLAMELSYG